MEQREIKFRAWDESTKKMWEPDFIFKDGRPGLRLGKGRASLYKMPVMQWTGLKDRNRKDIFEGDIVRHLDGFDFTIRFHLDRFEASRQRGDKTWDWRPLYECSNIVWVIGNIYENANLLAGV